MCVTGFCHGPERPRSPGAFRVWPAASWELFILALSDFFFVPHLFALGPAVSPFNYRQMNLYSSVRQNLHWQVCVCGGGVTLNHPCSLFIGAVCIPAPFKGHKMQQSCQCHVFPHFTCCVFMKNNETCVMRASECKGFISGQKRWDVWYKIIGYSKMFPWS